MRGQGPVPCSTSPCCVPVFAPSPKFAPHLCPFPVPSAAASRVWAWGDSCVAEGGGSKGRGEQGLGEAGGGRGAGIARQASGALSHTPCTLSCAVCGLMPLHPPNEPSWPMAGHGAELLLPPAVPQSKTRLSPPPMLMWGRGREKKSHVLGLSKYSNRAAWCVFVS